MPPQPVIPNWIRVVMRLAHEGSTMIVGLDMKGTNPGPYTGSDLGTLALNMYTTMGATWLAALNSTWSIQSIDATDRSVVGGAFAQHVPIGAVGTGSGDPLPANCAVVISKRTGLSGRRNHGRMYWPGLGDINATGSAVTPVYSTLLANIATALLSYTGTGSIPADWAIPSVRDLAMKVINSVVIDLVVDSQRRRLPGRGF